jgi:ABC-type phosphate transport system substrate-binding protein
MKILQLLMFILIGVSQGSVADLYVIAHKNFSQDSISVAKLRDIYSGDAQYVDQTRVIPLDQDLNTENRTIFYQFAVGRPMAQIISHWSKLIFTGKGQAPISLTGDASILEFVKKNPNAIGYVNTDTNTDDVKVLQTISVTL